MQFFLSWLNFRPLHFVFSFHLHSQPVTRSPWTKKDFSPGIIHNQCDMIFPSAESQLCSVHMTLVVGLWSGVLFSFWYVAV